MAKRFKRAARDRQALTNEAYCQALTEIRRLSADTPFIPPASPAQAEFEVEVLDRIGYGIRPQNLKRGIPHPFGIISVIPREHDLEMILIDDKPFVHFVSHVSPMLDSDHVGTAGVPGLRVSFNEHGAILYRVQSPGRITIRGVDRDSWEWALRQAFGEYEAIQDQYLGFLKGLHEVEEYEIEHYSFECDSPGHTSVGNHILSGILRRPHLFRARTQMRFTDLWFNYFSDGVVINLEWAGDLPHYEVIERLADHKFGLPLLVDEEERCYCEPCTANTYGIQMRDSLTGKVELHLRWSSLYKKELPRRKTGPCQFAASTGAGSSRRGRGA